MLTRSQVMDVLRPLKAELAERYRVRELALFGSLARQEQGPTSDVDLLVELSRPLGLEFVSLAHYLERRLGRKVDLATFETFRRSLTSPRYRDIALNIQESMADVQEEAR
jgi:hypothetical protein